MLLADGFEVLERRRRARRSRPRCTGGGSTRPAAGARACASRLAPRRRRRGSVRSNGADAREECAMPRDLRIDQWRPPRSPGGAFLSRIQVSISDDTPTSVSLRHPAARDEVSEERGDVSSLQEVDQPHHHAVDFAEAAAGEAPTTDRRRPATASARRRRDAWSRDEIRGRTASAGRHGCRAGPSSSSAPGRCQSIACCERTAPAIPRTESRARARRAGRRRP